MDQKLHYLAEERLRFPSLVQYLPMLYLQPFESHPLVPSGAEQNVVVETRSDGIIQFLNPVFV